MAGTIEEQRMKLLQHRIWKTCVPYCSLSLALGLIQAWANRFYMGNDGVSYLDMADAYLRGDLHAAINSSWNPLYAWFVCLDFLIVRPSSYWEYPSIQLVNFAIYGLTLAGFEYFLSGWLAWKQGNEAATRIVAYGLFLWSSLLLIGVWTVNADMLVAACLYTALGILIRAGNKRPASTAASIWLGVILAAGYYSKAVMFPLSLVFLFGAFIILRLNRALIATLVFGALSIPLMVALSDAAGHLTFGDTGRVNYAWYVDGVAFRWWQGGPDGAGQPIHPPSIALNSPRVYAFGGVFPKATYPVWYDFAYWYQGLHVRIEALKDARVICHNLKWFITLLARQGGGFLLGCGVCFLLYKSKRQILGDLASMWVIWLVSISALLLYCSVHIEARYIGVFTAVLLLAGYSALHIEGKWLAAGIVAASLLWAIAFAPPPTAGARYLPSLSRSANSSWQAATELEKLGLHPDDEVGSVSYSNRRNVLWARLARAHIVAETDWNVNFWQLSNSDQRDVLEALAQSGARVAVSDEPPPGGARALGWRQAGNSNYYAYSLSQLSMSRKRDTNSFDASVIRNTHTLLP